jgi:hypothetical protein
MQGDATMKKLLTLLLLSCITSLLYSAQAMAVGFGFYGSVGKGSAEWDDDYLTASPIFELDSEHKAFGVTLDTSLASERLFNYHLNIGRETFTSKSFIDRGAATALGDLELEGLVMSHTFGFGGKFSDSFKMWLGPEIRWHWVEGSPDKASGFQVEGAGFGYGPSIGLNFNFDSGLTLMLKAGYIMSNYELDGEGFINGTYTSTDYDVDEEFTYVNLEIMFRTRSDF